MNWKELREQGKTCERCRIARERVKETGCTVSSVYDHGEDWCAAQSVETHGPATYGHPRVYVSIRP